MEIHVRLNLGDVWHKGEGPTLPHPLNNENGVAIGHVVEVLSEHLDGTVTARCLLKDTPEADVVKKHLVGREGQEVVLSEILGEDDEQ